MHREVNTVYEKRAIYICTHSFKHVLKISFTNSILTLIKYLKITQNRIIKFKFKSIQINFK